jgi:hypothetical protein
MELSGEGTPSEEVRLSRDQEPFFLPEDEDFESDLLLPLGGVVLGVVEAESLFAACL